MYVFVFIEAKGMNNLIRFSFSKLLDKDYSFFANNFVGSLTKKGMYFAKGFEGFTDTITFNILNNIIPIIFGVVILWRYSFWIPAVLLLILTLAVFIAIPIIRKRTVLVSLRHDASSALSGRFSDNITNMIAIKSFAGEEKEYKEFGKYADDFTTKWRKAADFQNLKFDTIMSPIYVATNTFGLVAAIFFTAKLSLPIGSIIVIFSYYSTITRVFWEINRVYRNIESTVTESAEFTQLFLTPPAVLDISNAPVLKISKSEINFNSVSFRYRDDESGKNFLENFNLEIKPNQKIGLVGSSGGGKTTITKLLLRFLDLESGEIMIDGQDISKITQKSLRENIGYVPQEPLLFHRSLFENISYGKEGATEEDVVKASRLAHAHEFIEKLPNGYQTLVGERGIKLSGGQRQRVAIARAILRDAPILILDEATSSLDSESEKYIQEGLKELMKNKTAIVIAHRLSTIKHLDRIIVLDDGKIIQDGIHDELIKKKTGIYAKLWGHQSGEFLKD